MGKLKDRLTITVSATLVGWRRLHPDFLAYSGHLAQIDGRVQYVSYLDFEEVQHFPAFSNHWTEHYIGLKLGVYVALYINQQFQTKGPTLL